MFNEMHRIRKYEDEFNQIISMSWNTSICNIIKLLWRLNSLIIFNNGILVNYLIPHFTNHISHFYDYSSAKVEHPVVQLLFSRNHIKKQK